MVVIVFRTRLKGAPEDEMGAMWMELCELAAAMPGYVAHKEFQAEDGEFATIVEFDTLAHLAAWRDHARHRVAQQRGRDEWFAGYRIQVCTVEREYGSAPPAGAA
jgi:heme-degrading monooxygenase HmoA